MNCCKWTIQRKNYSKSTKDCVSYFHTKQIPSNNNLEYEAMRTFAWTIVQPADSKCEKKNKLERTRAYAENQYLQMILIDVVWKDVLTEY